MAAKGPRSGRETDTSRTQNLHGKFYWGKGERKSEERERGKERDRCRERKRKRKKKYK